MAIFEEIEVNTLEELRRAEDTAALGSLRWQHSRLADLRAVLSKSSGADEITEGASSYGGAVWVNGLGLVNVL